MNIFWLLGGVGPFFCEMVGSGGYIWLVVGGGGYFLTGGRW